MTEVRRVYDARDLVVNFENNDKECYSVGSHQYYQPSFLNLTN